MNNKPLPKQIGDLDSLTTENKEDLVSALNEHGASLAEMKYYYTPEMFGTTGTADDTAVIQTALDYINANNTLGAELHFGNKAYKFTSCTIKTPNLTITSSGLLDGSFVVQSVDSLTVGTFNILSMNVVFNGVKFKSSARLAFAIKLQRLRDVTIKGCYFENYLISILGTSETPAFAWQRTARVKIIDNVFKFCDYCVQTQQVADDSSGTWVYYQHGDYIIQGNYFYSDSSSSTTSVLLNGQDGFICKGNFFFHGYGGYKNNLEINDSNFVIIEGNDFFEAGENAIKVDKPRNMIIKGNNIAWSGQKLPSPPININNTATSISSEMSIIIEGNNIAKTSSHGIYIGGNIIKVRVTNNTIGGVGTSNKYFDASLMPTVMYDIYVDTGSLLATDTNGINYKEDVVMDGNKGEMGTYYNRGQCFNYFRLDYLKAKSFFGNVISLKTFSGVVDFKATVSAKDPNPFNPNYPYWFKASAGTISNIINANVNQILFITTGVSGLTIQNSTDIILKGGANLTLTNNQLVMLVKSDTAWYQI
jgi:hypothetical protein